MLTRREWNVAKYVATQLRHEIGDRAQPPGPSGSYCRGHEKVTTAEGRELREYVRAALAEDRAAMRRYGRAA